MESPDTWKRRGILLIFFLGLVFACYPGLFIHFSTAVIRGDMGDLKNMLSIISYSINTPLSEIYHLPIFHPEPYMLAKTHPLFGISLFFKLFDMLGLSLTQSVNLYIIFSLVAGAWGTYLLSKEFTGAKYHLIGLAFSVIYILHPMNHLHFVWLNFLSRFYIPFIFLFLVRYFKTGKKGYAVVGAVFSFMQFLACLYYGVLLWALLIPLFILFVLVLKAGRLSRLWFLGGCLLIGFLLILYIYHPYITQNTQIAKQFDGKLVQVEELFSVSKVFSRFFGQPEQIRQYFFPGLIFASAVLLSWLAFQWRCKCIYISIALAALLSMCFLVYQDRNLLNLLFLLFMTFLGFLTITGWSQMTSWHKVFLLTAVTMSFILFQFTYPPFLKHLAVYRLFYSLLPVGGLTVIKRAFLLILPLFSVLAAVGTIQALPESWRNPRLSKNIPARRYLLLVILVLVMMVENIKDNTIYLRKDMELDDDPRIMVPLPQPAEVYKHLPFNEKKVLLEIPFYFRRRLKNVDYMFNQRFHCNYLLNGKVSILPETYYRTLSAIIGKFQIPFPNEKALIQLREKYSLDYIIIHWQLLEEYQGIRRKPVSREEIMNRVNNLKKYLQIIYVDHYHLLLKLKPA